MSFNSVAIFRISAPDQSSSPGFWSSGKSSYGSPVTSGVFSVALSYSSPVSSPQSGFLSVLGQPHGRWLVLTNDGGVVPWLVAALGLQVLDLSHDALAVDDLSVDDVLLVEMRCRDGGDEELRSIGA